MGLGNLDQLCVLGLPAVSLLWDIAEPHNDGLSWYCLFVHTSIIEWIIANFDETEYQCYNSRSNVIDVNERVFAIVQLKWGNV